MQLRCGFNIYTLPHFYSVSEVYIRKIFTTWMFLYHHFKDFKDLMFPDWHAFQHLKPKVFKYFHNIRYAIDCTKCFCEAPGNYAQQGNVYSSYKHYTNMKCLITVNQNGAACFISDLFEGSIDDVTLFNQCGIMNYINCGDFLLVDKGFTHSRQARVFIPPFLGERDSFT